MKKNYENENLDDLYNEDDEEKEERNYTNDDIEREGVKLIVSYFAGLEKIKTCLSDNDKTPFTDGQIRLNDNSFDVQVKSSLHKKEYQQNGKPKKNSIDYNYLNYAIRNTLIYFNCFDVFGRNPYFEYIIINYDTLKNNNALDIEKNGSKSFRSKKLIEKDFYRDLKKYIPKIKEITKDIKSFFEDSSGNFNIVFKEINDFEFQEEYKVKKIETIIRKENYDIDITKILDFEGDLILSSSEKEIERIISNKKIKYFLKVDLNKNFKIRIGKNWITVLNKSAKFKVNFNSKIDELDDFYLLTNSMIDTLVETNHQISSSENFKKEINEIIEFYKKIHYYYVEFNFQKIIDTYNIDSKKIFEDFTNLVTEIDKLKMNNKEGQIFFFSPIEDINIAILIVEIKGKKKLFDIKYIDSKFPLNKNINIKYFGLMYTKDFNTKLEKLSKCINFNVKENIFKYLNNIPIEFKDLMVLIGIFYYTSTKDQEVFDFLIQELEKNISDDNFFINYIQLKKHANKILKEEEKNRIRKIENTKNKSKKLKLCAAILLENETQVAIFESLNEKDKEEFMSFPIYKLYNDNI